MFPKVGPTADPCGTSHVTLRIVFLPTFNGLFLSLHLFYSYKLRVSVSLSFKKNYRLFLTNIHILLHNPSTIFYIDIDKKAEAFEFIEFVLYMYIIFRNTYSQFRYILITYSGNSSSSSRWTRGRRGRRN